MLKPNQIPQSATACMANDQISCGLRRIFSACTVDPTLIAVHQPKSPRKMAVAPRRAGVVMEASRNAAPMIASPHTGEVREQTRVASVRMEKVSDNVLRSRDSDLKKSRRKMYDPIRRLTESRQKVTKGWGPAAESRPAIMSDGHGDICGRKM